MPKYLHPDVLDNGLQHIIDQSGGNVDMLLITSYSQGAAYVTVLANAVMTINMAPGDFTLGAYGTYGRKLNVAQRSGTTSDNASTPDLHVAIVDVTNTKVLAVTDETGNQDIISGDPKTIPTFDINLDQPV